MSLQRKEITFRNWFEIKYGVVELDDNSRANYVHKEGIADTEKSFKRDFPNYNLSFNSVKNYLNKIQVEVLQNGSYELPRMTEGVEFSNVAPFDNGVTKRTEKPIEEVKPFEFSTFKMNDMQDKEPKLHKTGTLVDAIDSTYTEGGGLYGGTVTIVTGESGSGKTTLLVDKLAKYKKINPDIKVLYISTEMTRGDLRFYKMDLPAIGEIDTLLIMDYLRNGHLKQAVETAFETEYDVIVLDSFQDLLGKLADVVGWREKESQRYLIDLMLDSAENRGCAVISIQHLTKGGTYVGSTYLKHTTTAMLELKIDDSGRRYMYYSKNRRGGAMQFKPMYFDIDKELQEIVFDEEKFNNVINAEKLAKENAEKQKQSNDDFLDVIKKQQTAGEETSEPANVENDNIHPENNPELVFSDSETDEETNPVATNENTDTENINNVSKAMSEMAEDIEFSDIPDND